MQLFVGGKRLEPVGHVFEALAAIAELKCFDYRDSSRYVEYMAQIAKEASHNEYTFRSTNKARDKNAECIWNELRNLKN